MHRLFPTCVCCSVSRSVSLRLPTTAAAGHDGKWIRKRCWQLGGTVSLPTRPLVRNASTSLLFPDQIGQPTPTTHPHLLSEVNQEILVGITRSELQDRQHRLFDLLPKNKSSFILVQNNSLQYFGPDTHYPFLSNANFLYLTGCMEPGAAAVFQQDADGNRKYTLFVGARSKKDEIWNGPRVGLQLAGSHFGCDEAIDIERLPSYMFSASETMELGYLVNVQAKLQQRPSQSGTPPSRNLFRSGTALVESLRVRKSKAEQELMRVAGRIGAEAHCTLMKAVAKRAQGILDTEVSALLEYEMRKHGGFGHSYAPVVAGGSAAIIIHQLPNYQILKPNELLLIDAGCHYHGYVSDITRTYPLNGEWTQTQREVYEAVLEVSVRTAKVIETGAGSGASLRDVHYTSIKHMREALINLGFPPPVQVENHFMTAIGHFLGMDVHDTPTHSAAHPLQAGTLITIEPGLYLNFSDEVPAPYRGIGVRIEDDFLIHDDHCENLTELAPKRCDDISRLMLQ